ncbi:pterin-4-alpha-carbinolamine dehydratase 2, mitochondrial isoform X2 [Apium graveolens]|uniref:pterin-4-alpha-carbinolamine dehydratase 2, mitochondrial isoform X2 n=1 Tax=Apium graveolens TaxID=4045 RepID=UPI003D7A4B89
MSISVLELKLSSEEKSRFFAPLYSSSIRVAQMSWDTREVSSDRYRLGGFRSFCTVKDLSTKKCVPCNSDTLKAMNEEAANTLICQVPEWNLINQDGVLKLQRSWKAKTFMKGLEFFQAVAEVAEAEGHHPDLHLVGWNNVNIDIWTHSVAGLTENDFILAAKISGLNLPHLLRKQAGK